MTKKKTTTRKKTKPEPMPASGSALDYRPLYRAFSDAFEWALDVAASIARDFPEEVETVERVRTFVRYRLAGRPANITAEDVLFTFGLLIGAIDRDLGPIGSGVASTPLHFPTADIWDPQVPRRFNPTSWLQQHLFHTRARA